MIRDDAARPIRPADGPTRRDFLRAGSLAGLGMGLAKFEADGAESGGRDVNCILLFLVGGPSQLDTWDMKPDAPEEIRGPFRPIATRTPGIEISEVFPKMARRMDRVALVRSVHHGAAAVHDAGHQMMQTGRLFAGGVEHPHFGATLAYRKGARGDAPPHVLLPGPIGPTGGNMAHGQSGGYLGEAFDPFVPGSPSSPAPSSRAVREAFDLSREPAALRDHYGRARFGRSCLTARRLVERGTRFVTVNMFTTVFNETTWDIHGSAPFTPMDGLRDEVGPTFDAAYSALLDDLYNRGMLDSTMVLAFGEFGRTPRINPSGGRDHHPGCWTVLFAGGPIRGGQVVGSSDSIGSAPADRSVTPAEIAATVYHGLGIPPDAELPGPEGQLIRVVDGGAEPIGELFGR